jgi:hypothetical protein
MMTKRLRAGVLIRSEIQDKAYLFGYLTHPGLEYEIAIAIPEHNISSFEVTNKTFLNSEDDMYRFGLLLQSTDEQDNDIFTVKVHHNHKFFNLVIYASQYTELMRTGHEINSINESAIIEKISLNL